MRLWWWERGGKKEAVIKIDLLEFVLLGDFVFACFGCLSVELFGCELGWDELSEWECMTGVQVHTLRLKRAFSSPDMVLRDCG